MPLSIRPLSGRSVPQIIRSSVVLPDFGSARMPMRDLRSISRASWSKSRRWRPWTVTNFVTFSRAGRSSGGHSNARVSLAQEPECEQTNNPLSNQEQGASDRRDVRIEPVLTKEFFDMAASDST